MTTSYGRCSHFSARVQPGLESNLDYTANFSSKEVIKNSHGRHKLGWTFEPGPCTMHKTTSGLKRYMSTMDKSTSSYLRTQSYIHQFGRERHS